MKKNCKYVHIQLTDAGYNFGANISIFVLEVKSQTNCLSRVNWGNQFWVNKPRFDPVLILQFEHSISHTHKKYGRQTNILLTILICKYFPNDTIPAIKLSMQGKSTIYMPTFQNVHPGNICDKNQKR